MSEKIILVGQINGVFGVKGLIKVFSHTEPRGNILSYNPWLLKVDGKWKEINVLGGQVMQGGKSVVAQLEGLNDREIARGHSGIDIAIYESQLPDTDDFYWRDLIGCQVFNQDDVLLGNVSEMLETGVHDVMCITDENSPEPTLIPFVFEEFIQHIDTVSKRITVEWILD